MRNPNRLYTVKQLWLVEYKNDDIYALVHTEGRDVGVAVVRLTQEKVSEYGLDNPNKEHDPSWYYYDGHWYGTSWFTPDCMELDNVMGGVTEVNVDEALPEALDVMTLLIGDIDCFFD